MLDRYDVALLNEVQADDGRTADQLATVVALSPSAIARRLRRLRGEGWIARTIALLAPKLIAERLRAVILVQLKEHADLASKAALRRMLDEAAAIQFCWEVSGSWDLVLVTDSPHMASFNALMDTTLERSAAVLRYETSFVKREAKFSPRVELASAYEQRAVG